MRKYFDCEVSTLSLIYDEISKSKLFIVHINTQLLIDNDTCILPIYVSNTHNKNLRDEFGRLVYQSLNILYQNLPWKTIKKIVTKGI